MSSLPPIFPLKIHWLPSDSWMLVSRFCLKTFVLLSKSWAIPEVEAFLKNPPGTEHLSCRHPKLSTPSLDPQVLLASLARKVVPYSAPLLFLGWPSSSGHSLAQNLPACIFPSQEPFDMLRLRFSPNSPDSPHISTHHAQNGHGDNLAPTGYRLILFFVCVNIGMVKG